MPLSQHRPALAAILVAVVAVLTAFSATRPAAAAPSSDGIRSRALQDVGTWQGECWQFMKAVVRDATGIQVGFDYHYGYIEAGALEVGVNEAGPGDIIQIVDDSYTAPDADYSGLHTAIIVSSNGDGSFEVVDSNMNFDGMVNIRPAYNPAVIAAARGLNFHIYRFGGTASVAPPPPPYVVVPGKAGAGDKARVNAPGDCLRLRSGPGGSVTHCLGHGTQVSVTGGPVTVDGVSWTPVTTAAGTGWMATDFLQKEAPAAAGAGPTDGSSVKPVFKYRAFVTIASD